MKSWSKRIAMRVGGVVVAALLMALASPKVTHAIVSTLVTVANTTANPVPTQEAKDNYITLSLSNPESLTFDEIMPDGTIVSNYAVPSGEKLVITDISWTTVCVSGLGATCNKSAGDQVFIELTAQNATLYFSQAYYAGNYILSAGSKESLRSGIVVAQVPTPTFYDGTSGNGEGFLSFTLHGYLVP
jgi:hypothetical protein